MEDAYNIPMEEEHLMSFEDYLEILKHRKWEFIIPAIGIFLISIIIALSLPLTYKSTATILIEEQQIPTEFVKATTTSYAEQRIQHINQGIMSTGRLLEIINQFDLYKKFRADRSTHDIVERMRSKIQLEPISAEVMDRSLGRTVEATIAFSLSFQGNDTPKKIQRVTKRLTELFLEENVRKRTEQSTETSRFFKDESNKVKSSLDAQEARIAKFKEQHINTLPELLQTNIQSLNNVEHNIEMLQEQLRSLKEQEGYFQSQLINVSPDLEDEQEDKKHLDELKVRLVNLKTRFTDEYPDVINTRAEIAKLEHQLTKQKNQQSALPEAAKNPAYITLSAQLSGIQADIQATNQQITAMMGKAEKYRKQIEETPRVEETYKALTIERNNTRAKYDDLMQKLLDAQVSQGLESEQKGERFTLIEPPLLPEKPFKPNRLAIILIGIVLGIGAGASFITLKEFSDNSVHNIRSLTLATTFPVLATIPEMMTSQELAHKRKMNMLLASVAIAVIIGGIILFHLQMMTLNVL
jgi:succinoglycan biosynthesis transport protein ExoP